MEKTMQLAQEAFDNNDVSMLIDIKATFVRDQRYDEASQIRELEREAMKNLIEEGREPVDYPHKEVRERMDRVRKAYGDDLIDEINEQLEIFLNDAEEGVQDNDRETILDLMVQAAKWGLTKDIPYGARKVYRERANDINRG